MPLRIVQSKQNPRLKQLRRALAKPLGDAEAGGRMLAGLEGPNLLKEALRAGLHIECLFVAEGRGGLLAGRALTRRPVFSTLVWRLRRRRLWPPLLRPRTGPGRMSSIPSGRARP